MKRWYKLHREQCTEKRPGREADNSPPPSDEVKHAWNFTPYSPVRLNCVVLN